MKTEKNSIDSRLSREAMGQAEFAAFVIKYCRNKNKSLTLDYDRATFKVEDRTRGLSLSLFNLYLKYCTTNPSNREAVLAGHLEFLIESPKVPSTIAEAKGMLFPVIRNRWGLDIANTGRSPQDPSCPLARMLTPNLVVQLVCAFPNTVLYLPKSIAKDWGTDEEALFTAAIENMNMSMTERMFGGQAMSPNNSANNQGQTPFGSASLIRPRSGQSMPAAQSLDGGRRFIDPTAMNALGFVKVGNCPGLFAASGNDCSSYILADDLIRLIPVKGDPVVMVNHKGSLLIAGSEDATALLAMAILAQQGRDRSHPVSNIPIQLTPAGWKTYEPPRHQPAYNILSTLRSDEMGTLYAKQGEILRRSGREHSLVAPCFWTKLGDGSVETCLRWTLGWELLLPKADRVVFIFETMRRHEVLMLPPLPFEAVRAIVGHLMERTEYSPPRYLTRGCPSQQEIRKLYELVHQEAPVFSPPAKSNAPPSAA